MYNQSIQPPLARPARRLSSPLPSARGSARRGAMVNGCLVLVAAMAIVNALASQFAGYPPFHVVVATVSLMFAMVLSRSPGMRWQVEALAAVGAPAVISAMYGYMNQPDTETLKGTSGLLYVVSAGIFVLTCIVRGARSEGVNPDDIVEGEKK